MFYFRICFYFIALWSCFSNQQCQNVIAQVVGWENPNPTTKWKKLREHLPTITLGRYSCHFRDEVITSKNESW
jgi:hypothetical protein